MNVFGCLLGCDRNRNLIGEHKKNIFLRPHSFYSFNRHKFVNFIYQKKKKITHTRIKHKNMRGRHLFEFLFQFCVLSQVEPTNNISGFGIALCFNVNDEIFFPTKNRLRNVFFAQKFD